ncbi:MAG TPA: IPT/TIG domain-containing protein, partial [Puia sp.]|nr:IPT/TIG domain-containing protein [Puia sp.]
MPNLYPGIKPLFPGGRRLACLCLVVFLPAIIATIVPTIVIAQPTISSVAPLRGPVGTPVTISGNNFNATPSSNIVYFGSVRAQVT